MDKLLRFVFLCCASVTLMNASIVEGSVCNLGDQLVLSTTTCSLSIPPTAADQPPFDGGPPPSYGSLYADSIVTANTGGVFAENDIWAQVHDYGPSSFADSVSSTTTGSATYTTAGPPRLGFADIQFGWYRHLGDGNPSWLSLSDGSYSYSLGPCPSGATDCSSETHCCEPASFFTHLPILLGTPFSVNVNFGFSDLNATDVNEGGYVETQFSLFEADGTPVTVEALDDSVIGVEAPEPAPILFVGLGLLGLSVVGCRGGRESV